MREIKPPRPQIQDAGGTRFDLGSGFPGVVLACALAGMPGVAVHLVERNSPTTSTPGLMRGKPSSSNRRSFPNRKDIRTDG